MEIYEEPPTASRTAVKSKPPSTVQKSTALSSRKLFGELENGTVRKSTGKALPTPATTKKPGRVRFEVLPAEGGSSTTDSPVTKPATEPIVDWLDEDDDEIELPAGRTYLQELEHRRQPLPDIEQECMRVLAKFRHLIEADGEPVDMFEQEPIPPEPTIEEILARIGPPIPPPPPPPPGDVPFDLNSAFHFEGFDPSSDEDEA